jgi:autotransporter-associated beta strand protein
MKILKTALIPATIGLCLLAANSHATTRTWSGAGSDGNWTDAANWGGTAPAASGDSLVFSGSTRQNNTNNYSTISTTITFSSGGWNLWGNNVTLGGNMTSSTGNNVLNMNTPLSATRTITVSAGQLTLAGVVSGSGYGLTTAGSGTLVLGGVNTCSGTITLTSGAGNLVITNGHALGSGAVSIPRSGTATGTLQLNTTGVNTIANTINGVSSGTGGAAAVPHIENVAGTNTISSALTVTGGGGNGVMIMSDAGLLTLNGTVSTTMTSGRIAQFYGAGNGVVNGAIGTGGSYALAIYKYGTGKWTFNGANNINWTGVGLCIFAGTIALGPSATLNSTPITLGGSGPAVFDVSALSSGWTLLSGQSLSGTGGINGSVNTATSGTTITPGTTTTLGMLTFSNNLTLNGGTTINMNLSSDPTGLQYPSDLIIVDGSLSAYNTTTIQLGNYLNGYIPNGTYTLIQYGQTFTGSAANFAVTGFTAGLRGTQGGYITNTPGAISLVVTGTPPANLVWVGDGVNNAWDIQTSANWFNLNTSGLDEFYNYDAVTFDDTSTNFTVNISTTVTPGSVTVNATNNYTIGGAAIAGGANLTKLGSGTLTLTGNNTYTGINTFGAGSISVATIGPGGSASPLGATSEYLNGGTLEYTGGGETCNRIFSIGPRGGGVSVDTPGAVLTFSTSGGWVSSGAGYPALTKTGPGTLYFDNQESLLGTNSINGGILMLSDFYGPDVTSPLFINGGALDLNGQTMGAKPVVVAGMGDPAINTGAIINSGAAQAYGLQYVTMTGDTAFGGPNRWDIRGNPVVS